MEAIVLAGGLGTRLRSVVHDLPKCMAPVSGDPFLSYVLDWLSNYKITRVVLSVGYLKESIMDWVRRQDYPFQIDYAVEETPLGTGGGIKLALSKCKDRKVVVVNGDTFFPVDLDAIPFDAPITVALKPMKDFDRYGAVELSAEGLVTAFHEKAPVKEGLISGGVYALNGLDLGAYPEKFLFKYFSGTGYLPSVNPDRHIVS